MKPYFAVMLACITMSANAEIKDAYNFNYAGAGQKSILPIQVFDDGAKTIFHFRRGQRIPAVFVEKNGQWEHTSLKTEGSYYAYEGIGRAYKLKVGYSEANIKYTGSDRGEYKPAIDNSLSKRSYAATAKGDDFVWADNAEVGEDQVVFAVGTAKVSPQSARRFAELAKKLTNAKSIEVFGYSGFDDGEDLGRKRIDAIVNSLTSFGVERARIKSTSQVHGASHVTGGEIGARIEFTISKPFVEKPKPQPKSIDSVVPAKDHKANEITTVGKQLYRIEREDKTILDVLKRWGRTSGWTVIDVDFPHIEMDKPTNQEIAYGTFLEAVEKIKQGLVRKGYTKVEGKAYSDNVIEIGVFSAD